MKVSIAMATYNGEKFLNEQIDSILAQTIGDFELIICDDCSSDNTFSILEEYTKKDSRVRIYKNKVNIGFKKNFEKAISLCSGDYIALSDQDDIWELNHLEVLLHTINNNMVACGNANMIDGEGNNLGITLQNLESLDYIPTDMMDLAYTIIFFRNPFQGASMLLSRKFLEISMPIPGDVNDHDVWFASLSCFYGGLCYTETIVNNYRMHGKNVTGNRTKRRLKVRSLLGKLLFAKREDNRTAVICNVQKRLPNMQRQYKKFITDATTFFSRMSSFKGRLINLFFLLRHYSVIYSCDRNHCL